MTDWKIFRGDGTQHDGLLILPEPPPWRFARAPKPVQPATAPDDSELRRAMPFRPTEEMVRAVNAALYLRRPLLITGKPGSGKSTLISKVANELMLGPVLRWPINSRSTVRSGVYEYDAVGRLQSGEHIAPPVEDYLTLGPLGMALAAVGRPRALLVDEIDKSDLDFANDLLNVIDEGEYLIPELKRLRTRTSVVRDTTDQPITILDGLLRTDHFPFVVMTSNGEREFPAPFLRRCVRLNVTPPGEAQLRDIISSHLQAHADKLDAAAVNALITDFLKTNAEGDVSTDQLLNALFLTVTLPDGGERTFSDLELAALRSELMRPIASVNG